MSENVNVFTHALFSYSWNFIYQVFSLCQSSWSNTRGTSGHEKSGCKSSHNPKFGTRTHSLHSSLSFCEATQVLVSAFVVCRSDHCNSPLYGCPQYLINRLQKVQNSAARLILKVPKIVHITLHLQTLHWLPVDARIQYTICCLYFNDIKASVSSIPC